jgi:hypothetical protein
MLVFWQERLAILATPKTATTAIESALGALASVVIQRPAALKHTDAYSFERHWQPYLLQASGHRFEVAALMREPTAWLGSWYRDGQREDIDPNRSTLGLSFEDFVRACCANVGRPAYADIGSQAKFLGFEGGTSGTSPVDHLFRYEDLNSFVQFLEDRLDFEILLPRLKVSPIGDLKLSDDATALVRKTWAQDFALYQSLRAPAT